MKNLSVKTLKKQMRTLVTYSGNRRFTGQDTTVGTDPTNTVFTAVTTSSYANALYDARR